MSDQQRIAYEDLEVKIDDKPNRDGINVQEVLRRYEFQKNESFHQVPTQDYEVRRLLTLLNEPESRDGENDHARRERLIELLVTNEAHMDTFESTLQSRQPAMDETELHEDEEDDEFYTPADSELREARRYLIKYSTQRAKSRLNREAQNATSFDMKREINERRRQARRLKDFALSGSQVASSRPISSVKISPDDTHVAIGSWDGSVKTISIDNLEIRSSMDQAHSGKVGEVDWHYAGELLASGGEDGIINLFSTASGELRQEGVLKGHERRIGGTKFHPSGKYVASASFDHTWRLWDVQKQQELLLQEGHSKEVYCIAFQTDGALLCSGGFDYTPMVWDIRSGKCLMSLSGHTKPVYSVDWSPNGYHLATAGGDGTINVWDMRKSAQVQTMLAHESTVSVVRFDESSGNFLMSGSYDRDIKVYNSDSWINLAALKGHTDKILTLDITRDGSKMISAGWDRSIKLWTQD